MFTNEQKQIFSYFDGESHVWADPLRVYRLLMEALGGELAKVLEESQTTKVCSLCVGGIQKDCPECDGEGRVEEPCIAQPAKGRLVEAARHAFEMKPWDKTKGTGATEEDCQRAVNAYLEFLNKKKETPANSPTTSASTVIPQAGQPITGNSSASG